MKAYEVTWEKQRLSKSRVFRCLLSSILPMSVSKVLYLDCDVLVLSSLYGLWETDLTGVALAGVPDSFTVNPVHCRRLHYAPSYNYFNGGGLVAESGYWRVHEVERLCAEHYRMYSDRIVYNDQDLLNSLLHERKRLLDMKWNVQEGAYRRPKGKPAGWVPPLCRNDYPSGHFALFRAQALAIPLHASFATVVFRIREPAFRCGEEK